METLVEQTRKQIITDEIAVIEQAMQRLKLKRAKLLTLLSQDAE